MTPGTASTALFVLSRLPTLDLVTAMSRVPDLPRSRSGRETRPTPFNAAVRLVGREATKTG